MAEFPVRQCRKYPSVAAITLGLLAGLCMFSCAPEKKESSDLKAVGCAEGSFGYDLAFLERHTDPVVLRSKSGNARVIIIPQWQGRVMTSTATGPKGNSYGWINYELIESGRLQEHMNPFGGEDRLWLGPEGGQFSLFFRKGSAFDYENWHVPAAFDTEPFDLVSANHSQASFRKEVKLQNYSGSELCMSVDRRIEMLSSDGVAEMLGTGIPEKLDFVAYKGTNRITNTGENEWTRETGMPSVWILGMFRPSSSVTIVIPYREGSDSLMGPVVIDDYFGEVPADRLLVRNGIIYFRGDGKYRSKIGISPQRATPFTASYDESGNVLTLIHFNLPEGVTDYVNSQWKLQENPLAGDAINSYNDGPLEDGSMLGPFYELESSSPAASLKSRQSLEHVHSVFHFQGEEELLSKITGKVLGITIPEIKSIFE